MDLNKEKNRMKNFMIHVLSFLLLLCMTVTAQTERKVVLQKLNIPFIDRNGDGVNDVLQYQWGERLAARSQSQKKRLQGLSADSVKKSRKTDDKSASRFETVDVYGILKNGDKKVDANRDGTVDMTVQEYLDRHFRGFDDDGDGLPEVDYGERISKYMREMHQWLSQVRENVRNKKEPFPDVNSDGVPDNLPEGLWRGYRGYP
jgi:hypothetical protein